MKKNFKVEVRWTNEVQGIENNNDVTLLASSPVTKFQIFKYQNHAYGIQFHIEIKRKNLWKLQQSMSGDVKEFYARI